jgi:hypothetical protein
VPVLPTNGAKWNWSSGAALSGRLLKTGSHVDDVTSHVTFALLQGWTEFDPINLIKTEILKSADVDSSF